MTRISGFDLKPGQALASAYVVEERLGSGWEGEVYRVRERHTAIRRAVKVFFPQRNKNNATLRRYATKLDRLRRCPMVIRYLHTETIEHEGHRVSCLVSELDEGPVLSRYLASLPGKRMEPFEALSLVHALSLGLEEIHLAGEYHGDLHDGNVFIEREGVFFRPKVFDFFHRGRKRGTYQREDVIDLVRLLYDALGGPSTYKQQPDYIKAICRGLRNDLVRRQFPTATHLRHHLESFEWPLVR